MAALHRQGQAVKSDATLTRGLAHGARRDENLRLPFMCGVRQAL